MEIGPWVGAVGDLITLIGGIVLALDAINKEREFDHHKALDSVREAKGMGELVIQEKGVMLTDRDAVDRVFIRQTATQAIWGCSLLVGGFFVLLASRVLEILKK